MKVTFNDEGMLNFEVDLFNMVDSLPDNIKLELISALSCQETIIKFVGQQIFDVTNELHSSGGRTSSHKPYTELDKLSRRIAEESSNVANIEIAKLLHKIESLEKLNKELYEEISLVNASQEV